MLTSGSSYFKNSRASVSFDRKTGLNSRESAENRRQTLSMRSFKSLSELITAIGLMGKAPALRALVVFMAADVHFNIGSTVAHFQNKAIYQTDLAYGAVFVLSLCGPCKHILHTKNRAVAEIKKPPQKGGFCRNSEIEKLTSSRT